MQLQWRLLNRLSLLMDPSCANFTLLPLKYRHNFNQEQDGKSLVSVWLMNIESAQSNLPSKQTTHTAEVELGLVAYVATDAGR